MGLEILLTLLRKFWFLVPITILAVAAATFRIERDHARTDMDAARTEVAIIESSAKADAAERQKATDEANAKYESSTKAAVLLGDALASSVRDYENRLRSSTVRPAGESQQASGIDPVPGAIADVIAACARDAARLDNAAEWASALRR